jgi:radical SAM superfamily enzyme YgiQ (UPF0313 family)
MTFRVYFPRYQPTEKALMIRKVVLVQPWREGSLLGKAPSSPYTLMRLASLVPESIPVEIWDENLGGVDYSRLDKADLVGITCKTVNAERVREIVATARPYCGAVVVGGTHATLMPEDVSTWADTVVVGEGYHTWPKLIQDFDRGQLAPLYEDTTWAELDGVASLSDRVIAATQEKKRYWTPYLEITRGCPRNCTFCTAVRVSGRVMRLRKVEEVVEEIRRRDIRRFFLTDDNFGLNFRTNPEYISKVFSALEPLPLRGWTAQAEASVAQFPDLLDQARAAHCDKLFIGFESVNPGNRKELGGKGKGDVGDTRQVIRTLHDHGLGVVGLFVVGFDSDTPAVFQDTWDFIRGSDLDSVSVTVLTPFPATDSRRDLQEAGRLLPNLPWSDYDTCHVTYQPAQMTVEQLREGYDWLVRKIYSSGQIAARGLRFLRRYPVALMPSKLLSSVSSDIGYRYTYGYRNK